MQSTAAVLHEPIATHDFAADRPVAIETIEVAEPTGEEVLVEVVATSLCHTDVSCVVGEPPVPTPIVLGHEGAGIVRAVGDRVSSVEPGAHVVLGRMACGRCDFCRKGRSTLCRRRREADGTLRTGHRRFAGRDGEPYAHFGGVSSFTEYTVVTEEVAVEITDEIPLEEATLLGCGVFTGVGAVANVADVEAGSSVAIFGAGGVGLSGVQGAVLRGATEVVVVDVVPDKLDVARRLGATHTIDASEDDPVKRIREITGGGAEYAFDMVGDPSVIEQVLRSLGPGGTGVLVGAPAAGVHEIDVDVRDVVYSEKRLVGSLNGSYNLPLAIPMLADLVVAGKLSLDELITDTRPLEEVNEAMDALVTGSQLRQVLVP